MDACDAQAVAALVQSGDPKALERLACCYRDHLVQLGKRVCRDPSGAEDAVHDALSSAGRKLSQYRSQGSVESWLSQMVVNACRAQHRGRKNNATWNRPLEEASSVPAPICDPARCAARSQLSAKLIGALDALSAEDRALFISASLEEKTGPQLSQTLGISPQAARARLTRIRRKLRRELEEYWRDWSAPA